MNGTLVFKKLSCRTLSSIALNRTSLCAYVYRIHRHTPSLTRSQSSSGTHYGNENILLCSHSINLLKNNFESINWGGCGLLLSLSRQQLTSNHLAIPQDMGCLYHSVYSLEGSLNKNSDLVWPPGSQYWPGEDVYCPTAETCLQVNDVAVPDGSGTCIEKSCRSVLKQRRKKMNKHKYRKWRRKTRFVRRALGR